MWRSVNCSDEENSVEQTYGKQKRMYTLELGVCVMTLGFSNAEGRAIQHLMQIRKILYTDNPQGIIEDGSLNF